MFEQNVKKSVSSGRHNPKPFIRRGKDTLMKNDTVVKLIDPEEVAENAQSVLDELVREGARRMLQAALETEVQAFINHHKDKLMEDGTQAVVRNGRLPKRDVLTGAGPLYAVH